MATSVMLSIFSGRPNPRVDLSSDDLRELKERMARLQPGTARRISEVRPTDFGTFRVAVQSEGRARTFYVGGGLVDLPPMRFAYADTSGVALFLLDRFSKSVLSERVKDELRRTMLQKTRVKRRAVIACNPSPAPDAVPYDLYWGAGFTPDFQVWNRQPCNNCYNYANQVLTDTYAQPGIGGGQQYDAVTCASISAAAVRDGLAKVPPAAAGRSLKKGRGWYVALFIGNVAGEPDYHWLKQDSSGCWSHKLGTAMPSDIDFAGQTIKVGHKAVLVDPFGLIAARYDTFCGYFRTHAGVTIQGVEPAWCQPAY